ncbi:ketopantoate reductase family protein [Edaphobacillus lindanitolerans]|uniref:2-dehydropantoate 2-reductase n=1 Tax=Edaphobacillus lindanitolerans TaxID=550447 RepID=A0A1U7PL60_9BACI|nr:2-dehydropantoate 2-reductase [Edaphobacillus lindanitolerans]SIT67892.1 ketopantoate reductase [Edaphobacillus lindanitolerans]
MKLNIVGAGAVGLLLASGFADAGFKVRMLTRTEEQAALLRKEGVCVERDGIRHRFQVDASADPADWNGENPAILAMKSYDLKEFLDSHAAALEKSPLLFVQNGVAHLEWAGSLQNPEIAFATVEHGAMRIDGRTVRHTGTGPLRMAANRGASFLEPLAAADSPWFPVRIEEDPEKLLFTKAMKNAVINPITAILGVPNGTIASDPGLSRLAGLVHGELSAAFPELSGSVPLEDVLDLCRRTAGNESSMLADLRNGRRTESDAILGGLIREAERRDCPVQLLAGLAEMVAFKERRGRHV